MTKLNTLAALAIAASALAFSTSTFACGTTSMAYESDGYANELVIDNQGGGNQVGVKHNPSRNKTAIGLDGYCNTIADSLSQRSRSTTMMIGDDNASASILTRSRANTTMIGYDNTSIISGTDGNFDVNIVGNGTKVLIKSN